MLRIIKVTGNSLLPEYQEGDFVLIAKIPFLFKAFNQGDIVVFDKPPYGTLIKRVAEVNINKREYFVTGSHPLSIDSHQFGSIKHESVLGKVIGHIRKPANINNTG